MCFFIPSLLSFVFLPFNFQFSKVIHLAIENLQLIFHKRFGIFAKDSGSSFKGAPLKEDYLYQRPAYKPARFANSGV